MGAEWRRSLGVQGHMLHVSPAAQSYLRCVPPKRAAFCSPTPRRASKRAAFCRPTPRRGQKRAAFCRPTPRRPPKRAAFYSPTPRQCPKQAAFCRPTPRRGPKGGLFFTVPDCAVKKAACFSPFRAARRKRRPVFHHSGLRGQKQSRRSHRLTLGAMQTADGLRRIRSADGLTGPRPRGRGRGAWRRCR